MRGRKPKTAEAKRRNGSAAHNPDRVNKLEPAANREPPQMPSDYDGDKKIAWDWLTRELSNYSASFISSTYQIAMEQFCSAYAGERAAAALVDEHGILISTDRGELTRNPAALERHKCTETLLKYLTEFGFTPSSKTRVEAPAEAPKANSVLSHIANGITRN